MIKDIYLAIYILIHPNLGIVHTAFSLSSKTHRARPDHRFGVFSTDCSGGSSGGARGTRPPPLFLDENEARWVEKNFFEARPPVISGSG